MTPVIIGGIVVVLILLAVVAAYFMGFFGGEKVPASSSNDSALLEAMIDDSPKKSPATTPAATVEVDEVVEQTETPVLRCEEGQVESNGECIPIPAVSTPDPRFVYNSNIRYNGSGGNYYNYCQDGKKQGYCDNDTFAKACRDDCKLNQAVKLKSWQACDPNNNMCDTGDDCLRSGTDAETGVVHGFRCMTDDGAKWACNIAGGKWSSENKKCVYAGKPVYAKHEGYDFTPGADFGAATQGTTVDECKQVCTDREGCDGFTIGGVGRNSKCWYKRKPTDGSSGLVVTNRPVTTYLK
jgi:hypothetical protein